MTRITLECVVGEVWDAGTAPPTMGRTAPAGPAFEFEDAAIAGDVPTNCVWLLDQSDRRYNVALPEKYTARYNPLRIYDDRWDLVWTEGQRFDRDTLANGTAELWQRVPRECRV